MTLEDPFFVVKDEVFKALQKTRLLYGRWSDLQSAPSSKEELDWTHTELRNSLRSVDWDLDDLDDTLVIVEKQPVRFKLDNKELTARKNFIAATRSEVKAMKDKINMNRNRDKDRTARQPLLDSPVRQPTSHATTKYSKLRDEDDILSQQSQMLANQDEQLQRINEGVSVLKSVSVGIGVEVDEQAGMLDEFSTELEGTETKIDSTMKRIAKVLHMSNDRRQWTAIFVLSVLLLIVILLFFYL